MAEHEDTGMRGVWAYLTSTRRAHVHTIVAINITTVDPHWYHDMRIQAECVQCHKIYRCVYMSLIIN